jgi:membrane protease YdiL (CAAX protease family)
MGPSRRPSPWPALVAYAVAFVLALAASLGLVLAVGFLRAGEPARVQPEAEAFALSAAGLIAGALTNALVLGGVALVAARGMGRPRVELNLGPTRARAVDRVAVTVGLVGLSFACGSVSELLGVRGGGVMDTMAAALLHPSAPRFVAAVLAIGVAPGLAEETLFRGLMQTRLTASWGRWPAIVVSAAAFGLIHLDPVQGTLAFVAGLFLGWVVDRFGSARTSILAHVVNNVIFVALAAVGDGAEGSPRVEAWIGAAGASAWIAAIVLLRRRLRQTG